MKALVAAEVALLAAAAWLVSVAREPAQFAYDEFSLGRAEATGLAIAVGVAAAVVALGIARRGAADALVIAVACIGVAVLVGDARLLHLSLLAERVVGAVWLAGAGAVLAGFGAGLRSRGAPSLPGLPVVVTAVAASGALAGALGVGPHRTLVQDESGLASTALVLQLVLLVVGFVVIGRTVWPGRRWLVEPMPCSALAWVVVAIAERALHLLPLASYWNEQRGAYRPWAIILAVNLPIVATGSFVVALGWSFAVRPHSERLSSGLLVVPDRDPVAALRDDLAAWTGDPTIQLAYSDESGGWLWGTGRSPEVTPHYDRATTIISREGRPIGLLDHDISLAHAPDALHTAAELAGAAFEANRLVVLAEARLVEGRRLGERLLVADATTREQLLAELEAGPISQLDRCADAIRFGAPLGEVAESLRGVTSEVRELSHGLYPPELIDRGLAAVLPTHDGAPIRRLPPAVEITAFLLAADDPESTFDDDTAVLWVHRSRSITDASIRDRIEVLGGSMVGASVCLPLEDV